MEDLKEEIKLILKYMVITNMLVKTPTQEKHMINNYAEDLVKLCNKHFVSNNEVAVCAHEWVYYKPYNDYQCTRCGEWQDGTN